jgi:hypothetical protein
VLAGCGDDTKNASAATTTPDATTPSSAAASGPGAGFQQALAFAQCMRDNGVPDYPDPQQNGGKVTFDGSAMNTPEAQKALGACRDKMPQGNAARNGGRGPDSAKLAAWVKCLRDNGLAKLPDPDVSGDTITVNVGGTGITPDSQEFQKAQAACQAQYPGGMLKLEDGS